MKAKVYLFIISSIFLLQANAQQYLSEYDSTLFLRDTVTTVIRRMENLSFSGYIQPQFQLAQGKGISSYEGGNFSKFSDNRFMLRRARIRLDYQIPAKGKSLPYGVFTFQIDATERGTFVRDMFIRLYEPKAQNFSLVTGLFARPFGYEVNLSSGARETPERGRMSQTLMPTERDLGAEISYNPSHGKNIFKWDAGVFNGQGIATIPISDYDSYKDIISRVTIRPTPLLSSVMISGGLSFLYGGSRKDSVVYEMKQQNGATAFVADSNVNNYGSRAPKQYYGADIQLAFKHAWGKTEVRAEYWQGTQSATANSSATSGTLATGPTYIRKFNGAFFYLLQNIINSKNEIMVKYDWYDPNTKVSGTQIGAAGTNFNWADIKYSTLGFGYTHYFNDNLKMLVYYAMVMNEKTSLTSAKDNTDVARDYSQDVKDNVFTWRIQIRF